MRRNGFDSASFSGAGSASHAGDSFDAVLDRLGSSRFTSALAAAGVRLHLPQPAAEPGLAVALGGAGISLADLVRLYAALSNAGEVASLRYRPNDAAARGAAIFGPLAAWYVNDILAEAPPPLMGTVISGRSDTTRK